MLRSFRFVACHRAQLALALVASALVTVPRASVHAQAPAAVVSDLIKDIGDVESKMVALAKAVPADKYAWRPSKEVRSMGEVFLHVASDNYFIPAMVGIPADPASGIKGDDFKSVTAFEKQALSPDATAAALTKSFAYLKQVMAKTTPDKLTTEVTLFGRKSTMQQLWILTATHMHEHLGQAIAYARSNGVVPPWSK